MAAHQLSVVKLLRAVSGSFGQFGALCGLGLLHRAPGVCEKHSHTFTATTCSQDTAVLVCSRAGIQRHVCAVQRSAKTFVFSCLQGFFVRHLTSRTDTSPDCPKPDGAELPAQLDPEPFHPSRRLEQSSREASTWAESELREMWPQMAPVAGPQASKHYAPSSRNGKVYPSTMLMSFVISTCSTATVRFNE